MDKISCLPRPHPLCRLLLAAALLAAGFSDPFVPRATALPAGPPRPAPDVSLAAPFAPSLLPSTSGSPVACVIVAPDSLADVFQRLADYQTRTGRPTVVRGISTVRALDPRSNDLAQAVRSFLRSAFELWGARSAVIAADHEQIPLRMVRVLEPWIEDIPTDTYYADLDGTWDRNGNGIYGEVADSLDMIPDLTVGRLPATTRAEATAMVDKALRYMTNPPAGALTKSLLLAEVLFPSEWTPGGDIFVDGAVEAESLRVRVPGCAVSERYYENHTLYPGSASLTKSAALAAIGRGHNVVVHVGHGSRSQISVGSEIVTGSELAAVSSGDSAALWVSSNCASAAADYDCVAEKLVRRPNGGALAYVGATRDAWAANSAMFSKAFFGSIFGSGAPTLGEAVEAARAKFLPGARSELPVRWGYFETILLGAPSLRVWKCPPGALTVTRPSSVSIGASSFQVTVTAGGAPAESALVTVWKAGEDYRTVLTNASGVATVPFHPGTVGGFSLTVEKAGALPFLDSLTVLSSAPARFALLNGTARDDFGGDADGTVGSGETFGFGGTIQNVGGTASSGPLTVTVQAITAGVVVDVAATSAPALAAGFQTLVPAALRAHALAEPNVSRPEGLRLIVADAARSDTTEIAIAVGAPAALVARSAFSDTGTGNGNGTLEPGETASFAFTVGNDGGAGIRTAAIQLQNPAAGVTIVDPSASLGDIAAGAAVTAAALRFQVASVPAGRLFDLRIQDAYGHSWIIPIERTPPATPSGVRVQASTLDRLSLAWDAVQAADLAGYHVYRGPNDGSTPVRITTLPVRRVPAYEDQGLSNLTTYRYQVSGVDSSGNEGPRSTILVASTTPPGLTGWPVTLGQSTSSNVGLADLDGDGRPEILVGAEYLYVLRHDGSDWVDGDQAPATVGIFSTLLHNIASSPAAADLDLDGTPEIVAASWGDSTVAVFRADGSLQPGSWPRKGAAPFWSVPAIGNLDQDPELEIVIGSNAQQLYAWNVDGSEVMDGDANPSTQGVYFAPPGMGTVISSPAVTDLNGDGLREVVFGTSAGRVYVVRAGTVLPGWPFQATGLMSSSPAVGDIVPGGGLEVAVACSNDSVYVLTASGARAPGWPRHLELTPGNGRVNSVALAPLRAHLGDPSLCVVVAGTDGRVAAFSPSGATLAGWSAVSVGAATEASPAIADLDGDGTLEVLLGAEDRKLHAFRFDGTPVSGFPIETAAEVRGTPAIWDLDGDGATDIVVAGWDRLLRAWRYPGTFQKKGMAWPMFHHDGWRTGVATFPILTGAEPPAGEPSPAPEARATLDQNRPNPFNPSTVIGYSVPGSAPARVTIRVYTVAGRLVRTLVSRSVEPGYHEARWDGTDDHGRPAASGVYLYRAEIGAVTLTRKMALLR